MTDEQFRQLRTLILDQSVEIKMLTSAVRQLQRQLRELTVEDAEDYKGQTIYTTEALEELIKTRSPPEPDTDKG